MNLCSRDCEKTPYYQRQCAKTRFTITTCFAADQYASLGVYWGHGILDGSGLQPQYGIRRIFCYTMTTNWSTIDDILPERGEGYEPPG